MGRGGGDRAEVILGADSRQLDPQLRRATRKFKRWGKGVRSSVSSTFKGIGRSLASMGGYAGVGTVALIGKQVIDLDKRMTKFALNSRKGGESVRDIVGNLGGELKRISNLTGLGKDDVMGGVEAYLSATGDASGAIKNAELFAKVVQVTGANMEDVSKAAAALSKTMDFTPENFERAFDILVAGGRAGAIEIKEIAGLIGSLAPQFQTFGESGEKGLARLNGALQTIAPEFGFNAAETATGLAAFMSATEKKAAQIKKLLGVDVYKRDERGRLTNEKRDMKSIVEDIGKGGHSDTKLIKAFGRTEAKRAFKALYENGDAWQELTDAGMEAKVVANDFLTVQESAGNKIARSWQRAKNKLADVFTAERIDKAVDAFAKFTDLLSFAVDNMGKIVALLVGAKLGQGFIQVAGIMEGSKSFKGNLSGGAKIFGAALGLEIGYSLGRVLDEYLGISDSFSKLADPSKDKVNFEYLRDNAGKYGKGKAGDLQGRGILQLAAEGGLIGAGGVDYGRAFEVANTDSADMQRFMGREKFGIMDVLADKKAFDVVLGLERAAKQFPDTLSVKVEMAKDGALKSQAELKRTVKRFAPTGAI